jgi:cytochrome c-type biogenesis protein CcmH
MRYSIFHRRGRSETLPYTTPIIIIIMALFVVQVYAQDATPAVTDDQVNSVASQMYCPVCENIPLDVCGTEACAQWRDEIRSQLQAGRTADQVIADFVARYGDRVVGTPQNPGLRALSLVTPWVIALLVVAVALWVLNRWRQNKRVFVGEGLRPSPAAGLTDDDYRARIEQDLQSRR